MAQHIYPDNPVKQEQFVRIYLPRFMANAARYYMGDSTLVEPHVVRVALDGTSNLVPNPNLQETESGEFENVEDAK